MTALEQTAATLRPWLGSAFVAAHAELMERITMRLRHFDPARGSLHDSAVDIDSLLFMAVRNHTQGRMALPMDDGQLIRVKLSDFATMTDELMYLLMVGMAKNEANFRLLRDYSMRQGSLAALKTLYLHYQEYQSEEEYRTVRRVITSCHPAFRWRGWLEP